LLQSQLFPSFASVLLLKLLLSNNSHQRPHLRLSLQLKPCMDQTGLKIENMVSG